MVLIASHPGTANSRRRAIGAWATLVGMLFLVQVAGGIETALHFSGAPVDGPFQLYNALRRIAAGQRGGVDFQFFHGMGVPYLHYLPFRLMGGTFTASELARQLVSIAAYPLVLIVFFGAFTRDWARTFALSAIVYAVSITLHLGVVLTPLVSMLGLRSTVTTLVPAAFCVRAHPRARGALVGLALGISLLLGTEQGVAVILAFLLVSGAVVCRTHERRARIMESSISLAVMSVTVAVVLVAIGGVAGMKGALHYNLKLVPMEQFWYFGVPASVFAPTWHAVLDLMRQMPRIPETIVVAIIVIVVQLRRLGREPNGDDGRRHAALAILALYGLISCASVLGIFFDTYVQPCIRVLLMIGALELDGALARHDARLGRLSRFHVSRGVVIVAAVAVIAMLLTVPSVIRGVIFTGPHVIADHVIRRHRPTWEGIWPQTVIEGQRVVDQHRGPSGEPPILWSTYSGLLEGRNGIFNPSPFDYALHALGPANRAAYVAQFRTSKPTLVQTVLPTYSMSEIWMEQTSWDFYAELLRNYRAIAGTPWSIFWERLPAPGPAPVALWSMNLPAGATSVDIAVGNRFPLDTSVMLLQVELEYRVHNRLRAVPFIGAMPRNFVTVSNSISRFPVTLDPYTTQARFPVIAVRGRNPRLSFETYSLLPGAGYDVRAVRVSSLSIDRNNIGWMMNLIDEERNRQPMGPGNDTTGKYRWR